MTFRAPERTASASFVIRCYRPGDGAAVHEAVTASFDHLEPWMPWVDREQTLAQTEGLMRSFRARYLIGEDFVLGVWTPDEARLLGGTGFHLREGGLETHQAEIGMWIRAQEVGRGLGTAVLRHMLRWGFDEWGFLRLSWRCSADNLASQRLAERAGMAWEGVLRGQHDEVSGGRCDTVCFGALAGEWATGSVATGQHP